MGVERQPNLRFNNLPVFVKSGDAVMGDRVTGEEIRDAELKYLKN